MKIVRLREHARLNVGFYKYIVILNKGSEYLFYNSEMPIFQSQGEITGDFTPHWNREKFESNPEEILFFISGHYYHAALDIQFLLNFKSLFPKARVNVVSHIDVLNIIRFLGFEGGWIRYPILHEHCKSHENHLLVEQNWETYTADGRKVIQAYNSYYPGLISQQPEVTLNINPAVERVLRRKISRSAENILLFATSEFYMMDYPLDLFFDLKNALEKEGFHVLLYGYPRSEIGADYKGLSHNIGIYTDFTEIIYLLSQVDLVIAPDSMVARLSGMLQKPTVLLLNVQSPALYSGFKSIHAMQPDAPCSPCFRVDKCPLGYEKCMAIQDGSVDLSRILEQVKLMI